MATLPFIASLYIRLIYLTNKKVFRLPSKIPDEPIIFAFWHGDLLMQPFIYQQLRKTPHAKVMISGHFDGQLIAKTVGYLKLESIFSDKRSPAKLALQALRSIKNGYDIGITPDGPRGPRHEASDGLVMLAQKMKAPVVFFHCVPSKYRQLGSWDKFVIPKLFGTLEFFASEPISIASLSADEAKEKIQEGLMRHAF
jgi:lysophospholipid acyltransferase (LPLAT)-like uncharacterized protein